MMQTVEPIFQPMFSDKELFVYKRHRDDGLSINIPTEEALWAMNVGILPGISRVEFEDDVTRQVADGIDEEVARKFLTAMCHGGTDRKTAVQLCRDRCIPRRGYNIVPITRADVPDDRTFRDAWKFSHNQRVFYVDLEVARPIQYKRYVHMVRDENRRREEDMYGKKELTFSRDWLTFNIEQARDEHELARVLPDLTQ